MNAKDLLPFTLIAIVAATGCASISSSPLGNGATASGLVYFLPKKAIKVDYTVPADGKRSTLTIAPTEAYPDLKHRYVATFNRNFVGKNELDITVSDKGLLTTGNATTTSQIGEILKELAGAAGTFPMTAALRDKPQQPCSATGTYSTVLRLEDFASGRADFCGIEFRLLDAPVSAATPARDAPTPVAGPESMSTGFYYRVNRPFTLEVTYDSTRPAERYLMILPDESTTHFLPVERALFANAKSNFTFKDGMATTYKQEAESEILGIAKIPASVLESYFAAVGKAFDSRKGADTNERQFLLGSIATRACKAAIDAGDLTAAKQACQ